jgi:glycosyltransferase-like protein
MLKIALFTYSTKPRGSVIHTLELAQALHDIGHEVCVYALDKDGRGFDFPLSCQYQLIPAQEAPTEIDTLIQQRIQEFIDYLSQSSLTYDCYHAQDCISANALAELVQQKQIPHFIRTVHHIEDYSSLYLQQCQERSILLANLCLCVSQKWHSELQQHYQIQAPRVINGIDIRRFSPLSHRLESSLKQRLGLFGAPIYLSVGGIEPRKNSLRLLQAFGLVLETYPEAQLIIAGGSTLFDYRSYRDEFFALVQDLKIEIGHSLILPGAIANSELPALYRSADAFVFPSLKEGWGLVVLEAIASGLPIITSNQAPFTEFLTPDQALLIDPTSPENIAEAMQAIRRSDLAPSLIQQSQSILTDYTWETSAKMHLNHYERLLADYARNSLSDSMA